MADPASPLPRGTVVRFGSLEFMSLGHGYDMALLSVGNPSGSRGKPPSSGRAERRPRHHASPPRRRRNRRRPRHQPASGPGPAASSPSSATDAGPLIESPGVSRGVRAVPVAHLLGEPATTHPASTVPEPPNLLPHGLFGARRRFPFGLDNAAMAYFVAMRSRMSAREGRPEALLGATVGLA